MLTKSLPAKIILPFIAAVIIFVLFSFENNYEKPETNPEPPATRELQLGLSPHPDIGLCVIGLDKGFFLEHHLYLTFKNYESNSETFHTGLAKGEVQIAVTDDLTMSMAAFDTQRFFIIASLSTSDSFMGIAARRDRGITKAADLQGKTIGVQKRSPAHYFLSTFLADNSVDAHEIRFNDMPNKKLSPSLANGEIDAIVAEAPYLEQARTRLGVEAISFTMPGEYRRRQLLVVSKKFFTSNPEIVVSLIKGLVKAGQYAEQYPMESWKIVSRKLGIMENQASLRAWRSLQLKVSLDQSLLHLMEEQARWAISNGLVKSTTIPDYLNIFFSTPLETVDPGAVTIIR